MTREQALYARKEALIGVVINSALSALFAFIVFGGRGSVAIAEVAFDAFPQCFMIALMTTIVPTVLTRRRLRAGSVAPLDSAAPKLPQNLFVRSLLVALAAAAIGGSLHILVLPMLGPRSWPFATILVYKIAFGGLLALVLGPFILRRALADKRLQGEDA